MQHSLSKGGCSRGENGMVQTIALVTRGTDRAPVTRGETAALCQRTQGHCRAQVFEELNTIYFMLKLLSRVSSVCFSHTCHLELGVHRGRFQVKIMNVGTSPKPKEKCPIKRSLTNLIGHCWVVTSDRLTERDLHLRASTQYSDFFFFTVCCHSPRYRFPVSPFLNTHSWGLL